MLEHYYNEQPQVQSDEQAFETSIRNDKFSFTSDRGVFAKGGIDFGSRLLIEAFVEPDIYGQILDMGCGYGPIGIALAKITGRDVTMTDINERAVQLAEKNITQNNAPWVRVVAGDLYSGLGNDERFAVIVTNPPIRAGKAVVHRMISEAGNYLLADGSLWMVIQKKQGAPSAKKKLQELYEEVNVVEKDKGYYVFKAQGFREPGAK
ncbi:16S rRNA (guanine1207-N2)-methyltransferase [Geomicrobium halophilum]|uniref:16S rRNA (Guanine1207-N2)-methyltransferase n=1 Tax=Geomicrobium halophilum TaxID=549000 RepID=A0A841PRB4_9BACL|nr:class I SAM-dependent methyltransferase [Geomicrobium halophilum]MBB6451447.1 16S rRNA (guanine1207-N2)-methyltransferase [Geomicrobium halophilum]